MYVKKALDKLLRLEITYYGRATEFSKLLLDHSKISWIILEPHQAH